MATDHAAIALEDRECRIRRWERVVRSPREAVPDPERQINPELTKRRRNVPFRKVGLSTLTGGAIVLLLLSKRTALTRSFGRIGHPQWWWVALGIALELASMATVAMMQRRLLRIGGRRVGARPMMATIFAANALSVSVPVAGPELGAAFTFRRFKQLGADTPLAGWALLVGGIASWFGAIVVLLAGGVVSGNVFVTGATVLAGLLTITVGLAVWVRVGRSRLRELVGRSAIRLVRHVPRFLTRRVEDPAAAVKAWVEGLQSLRPTKAEWGKVGGLGLANWLTDIGVLAASILALGGAVPWRSLLLIYALATLIGSLGITPGGIGLVEGTLCLGLVSTGVPAALALAAVLLYRLVSLWLVMATGWVVLLYLRLERMREMRPSKELVSTRLAGSTAPS
jgi:putative heme transporter